MEVTNIDLPDQIARFLHQKTEEKVNTVKRTVSDKVMKELEIDGSGEATQEVITQLLFRGERILLPEWVTRMCHFSEQKEYAVRSKKGKVEIEEMK